MLKTLTAAAIVLTVFAAAPSAQADFGNLDPSNHGLYSNGRSVQGRSVQGRSVQGRSAQGRSWQGRSVQGTAMTGTSVPDDTSMRVLAIELPPAR